MKLIYCKECKDIVKLHGIRRTCLCGKSWGQYKEDGLHSTVGGQAIPLGFANTSFATALKSRPVEGIGFRFTAFVIPVMCPTVKEGSNE